MGKVLSLLAVLAHLTSLLSSSVFGLLYRATLETGPNAIFLVIAGTYLVYAGLMFTVDYKIKRMKRVDKEGDPEIKLEDVKQPVSEL